MPSRPTFKRKNSEDKEFTVNFAKHQNLNVPPTVTPHAFNKHGDFAPDTVVSCNANGTIASVFSDMIWNFSAYASVTTQTTTLQFLKQNFNSQNQAYPDVATNSIILEIKSVLFFLMISPTDRTPDFNCFYKYHNTLNQLGKFCLSKSISLKALFNTKGGNGLIPFAKETNYLAGQLPFISKQLAFLQNFGFKHGFKRISQRVSTKLFQIINFYHADSKKSPVIPSRIYIAIIHDTIAEYDALLPVLDELLLMQAEIDRHKMIGLCADYQKSCSKRYCGTTFSKLKTYYPTNYDLAKKYPKARIYLNTQWPNGRSKALENGFDFDVFYDRIDVLKALDYIRRVCLDILILFTGMRPSEAKLLPYCGSKETIVDGVKYWLIYGFALKKRNNIQPVEMWVTNHYGYKAFSTAQRIAEIYYARNNREPITELPDMKTLTPQLSPLFLSDNNTFMSIVGGLRSTPFKKHEYIITNDDLDELRMIDPHRVWNGEAAFSVGKPFPVSRSLFRRTLAFFSSASGVRLVVLKNQLHHLFEQQTFSYAQGSGRANPFLAHKDSFANYFNQVRHEAEAFTFINEAINYDGKLFGGAAKYAENNEKLFNTIRNQDRDETVLLFKQGRLAYKETHLGGCMTTQPCQSKALSSLTACLSCEGALIKPENLSHAINAQEDFVTKLNRKRLEYRTESQELLAMLDFAIKHISNWISTLDRRKKTYKSYRQHLGKFKKMKAKYVKLVKQLIEQPA